MKIKDNKCKCGHDDFFFVDKGNQTGIYCVNCGKWLKWADKDEKNLRMKQQISVLDKIRAEIWDLQYDDEEKNMTDEDKADVYNNAIKQVIEIIDKYKAKSESNGK